MQVFADKGFDAAPMQEIANLAGVHVPHLSYHFKNKLNLWKAAVNRAFNEFQEELSGRILNIKDSKDDVRERQAIRQFIYLMGEQPAFILFMHEEGKRRGDRMRWLVDTHVRRLFEMSTAFIQQAQLRGLVSNSISPVYFHYILSGAMTFIFHQAEECRRLSGIVMKNQANIETHARAVVIALFGAENH